MVLEIKLFAFALAFNYMLTHKMAYKSSPGWNIIKDSNESILCNVKVFIEKEEDLVVFSRWGSINNES